MHRESVLGFQPSPGGVGGVARVQDEVTAESAISTTRLVVLADEAHVAESPGVAHVIAA